MPLIAPRRQRGISLVELLVGVTVGLFVAAAAGMLVATQLADNRKLLAETQLQQDLRSAVDIMTRELRRSGYSDAASEWVWPPTTLGENAFATVTLTGTTQIVFKYRRAAFDEGPYGFRYDSTAQTIQSQLGGTGWQELTDPRAVKVTAFNVRAVDTGGEVALPCPRLCSDGTDACWPRQLVREYVISITGQAANDASVQRSLQTRVRMRNDSVRFTDPAYPTRICPK